MDYLWFVLAGSVAGVCAGLFGVGGGLIIVPALIWILTAQGLPAQSVPHIAVGTALATIVLTSISSMSAHHKRGGVNWAIFKNMAKGLVVGSLGGAYIATLMNGQALQGVIGVGAMAMAIKMLFFPNAENPNKSIPKPYIQSVAGGVIGTLSAIFGIGGGSLTVPYLTHNGVPMKQAVGTSSACGLPIAIAGAMGFVAFGMTAKEVPIAGTIGFVHIGAFLSISVVSFMMAKVGAKLAHILPAKQLKQAFGALLLVVGLQMAWRGFGVA